MYEDKAIVCKDCGTEFTFTAGEQQFYAEKGFDNEPKKCKECRQKAKRGFSRPNNGGQRRSFDR
ncbi:DNA replicative helicase MCM subunit Mcm2 (Cdc46/Mcm family) [Anaerosolibacter carboniphilus]|uniref:DNA replicative helicase MCM subunit Mcm2 (Cdc46/Mcm family) n=1 Tax=Anaerosolibacter carboniphilus TaxID=1417629 RepID=A0A841L437_9FIRM|nr:DNA replicative helicase MCM subunit Mcm2 (Cdc46/Mcm family) [Anaerosolibacter carboniphilus]